jgi:hypothetical protein
MVVVEGFYVSFNFAEVTCWFIIVLCGCLGLWLGMDAQVLTSELLGDLADAKSGR